MTFKKDNESKKGTFKLNPAGKPKEIDISPAEENAKTLEGIYVIEKENTLKICLSSPSAKNILIFRRRKSVYIACHPVPQKGRFAIVTNVGAGCDGRGRCARRAYWRGRRSRVVLDTQCRCRRWLAGLVRRGEHEGSR